MLGQPPSDMHGDDPVTKLTLTDYGHQHLMREATRRIYFDRGGMATLITAQSQRLRELRGAGDLKGYSTFDVYLLSSELPDMSAFIHFLLCGKNCPMCEERTFGERVVVLRCGVQKV